MSYQVSEIDYLNDLFPFVKTEDMPISIYIKEMQDCIVDLSSLLERLSSPDDVTKMYWILVRLSGNRQMMLELRKAVYNYFTDKIARTPLDPRDRD